MKLIDYLKAQEKTVAAFAEEIGETVNTVRKIVYGQRQPSLPLAVKIAAATKGEVTAADLVLEEHLAKGAPAKNPNANKFLAPPSAKDDAA